MDALREAVVNAIVHRNYAIKRTSIYVRVFDDRVEIENPGGLVEGMVKRDFGKSSVRRNPIIADLFHRMDKVERMGTGINRMRTLMIEAGLKEPVFEMDSFFRAIFYRDPRYSLKADRFQKFGEKVGGTMVKTKEKRLVDRLAESQKQILQLVKSKLSDFSLICHSCGCRNPVFKGNRFLHPQE